MFVRYALYHAPPTGSALARLGAEWLGRDAAGGEGAQVAAALPGTRGLARLTAAPRRYGLHATLKPPMRLAEGQDEPALLAAVQDWAARRAVVEIGPLVIATLGPFLALVPERKPQALSDLAADLVRAFDRFRAAPSAEELARRRAQGLSPRQEALLAQWGYPHVMEEFRFHITLTDRLEPQELAPVRAAAEAQFAPVIGVPARIEDIAVFGEDRAGLFHVIRRFPLGG